MRKFLATRHARGRRRRRLVSFLQKYKIQGLEQPDAGAARRSQLDRRSRPRGAAADASSDKAGTIRIASFNIQVFGEKKVGDPRVRSLLVEIIRQFDVVAIQEIRSQQDILPQFVDAINADGPALRLRDRSAAGTQQQQRAIRVRLRHGQHRDRSHVALHGGRSRRPVASRAAGRLVSRARAAARPGVHLLAGRHSHRSRRNGAASSTRWPTCFARCATTAGARTT